MKTLLTTALATIALAGTPALAQTDQGGSNQGQTQTQATQGQNQGTQSAQGMQGGMDREQMAVSQQRVIDTLNQAGLTDVQIMDAAFLVQATTPNDEQVIMIVNSAGQPVSAPRMGQSDQMQQRQGATQQGQGQTGGETQSSN